MHNLTVENIVLPIFDSVTDLGVVIDCELTFTKHILGIVSKAKAKQRIFLIFKSFQSRDVKLLVFAYVTYIRPIVEYCSIIWSPSKLRDIDLLEDIQRYFTKRLHGLWKLTYPERLAVCSLQSLELRRLIIIFKIVHRLVSLDFDKFVVLAPNKRTRGHNFKLSLQRCSNRKRQNFFAGRIIPILNFLPIGLVNVATVLIFKRGLELVNFEPFLARSHDIFVDDLV